MPARHPDLLQPHDWAGLPDDQLPRYEAEQDERYRRTDYSEVLQHAARMAFARNIAAGEAGIQLAEAALQVAAEDDAIATSSTVPFPVDSFLQRLQALADEFARVRLPALGADPLPAAVAAALDHYLFTEKRFRAAKAGRSALPAHALVDHPGTWEDARSGYLNQLLVRRAGHHAALAILTTDVLQRLLLGGAIDWGFTMDCRDFGGLPRPVPQPQWRRASLLQPGGQLLNTCTSEALVELLRLLKRAYWPFPWDTNVDSYEQGGKGSHGGFRAAAKAALGEDGTADLQAVSIVANHRLERGIWTSPGAGDLRRCVAAAERLVMLVGAEEPEERRDLAVLLLHAGRLEQAAAELQVYLASRNHRTGSPFDGRLALQLWDLAAQALAAVEAGGAGRVRLPAPVSVEQQLALPPPRLPIIEEQRRPLTW